ncbi:MAG: DciA family protein [Candidatus Melainabacteria bacterium]
MPHPDKLSDILPQVAADIRLDEKVHELSLLSLWRTVSAELLPGALQKGVEAARLVRQSDRVTLEVRVEHPGLANALSMYTEPLLMALNRFTPQTGITVHALRFRVT